MHWHYFFKLWNFFQTFFFSFFPLPSLPPSLQVSASCSSSSSIPLPQRGRDSTWSPRRLHLSLSELSSSVPAWLSRSWTTSLDNPWHNVSTRLHPNRLFISRNSLFQLYKDAARLANKIANIFYLKGLAGERVTSVTFKLSSRPLENLKIMWKCDSHG